MKRSVGTLMFAALAATSCSDDGDFVAIEPIGDADLRIVLIRGRGGPQLEVLSGDAPFRLAPGALQAEFIDGRLPIWVFGFRQSDLVARFPALEGFARPELRAALNPVLEAPGPGRFAPPPPVVALQAVLTEDSARSVEYQPADWATLSASPETMITFALAGALVCPPVGRPFRVFRRDAPESACVFRRTEQCTWSTDGCAHASDIFGRDGTLREDASGHLIIGDSVSQTVDETVCVPRTPQSAAPTLGETHAWGCGDRVIAAQREVDRRPGVPWTLDTVIALSNAELSSPRRWSTGSLGAWLAVDRSLDDLRIRRVLVAEDSASYQSLGIPLPDDGAGRRIRSEDGIRVELTSGVFRFSVGLGAQCLRLPDPIRGDRFFTIRNIAGTEAELEAPGLGAPLASTSRWAIAGDPGTVDSNDPPGEDELRLPAGFGPLVALSSTPVQDAIVVHGRDRTVRIPRVRSIVGATDIFGCPLTVPHPDGLVGPIVASGPEHLALMADGVLRLGPDGAPRSRVTVDGITFDDSYRLERRTSADGEEVSLVYQPESSVLWILRDDSPPTRRALPAPILATVDGPQVILRRGTSALGLRDPSAADSAPDVRYDIPAFSDTPPPSLAVRPEAVARIGGALIVGFSRGPFVGALDLRTGLSQARPAPAGTVVEALVPDESNQALWLITRTDANASTLELVRVPAPPLTPM